MKNHTSMKNLFFPVAMVLALVGSLVALRSVGAQATSVSAQDIQRWSVPNGDIITMFSDGNILASACQSCPSQIINHRTGSTINPNFPGVTGVAFARPAIRLSSTESDSVIGGWENQWRFSKDAVQKWVKPVGCCNSASTPWALDTATNKAYMVGGVLNGMGEVDMDSGMYVNPGPFTTPNFAWSAEPVFVSMADSDNFYLAARTGWIARLYPFNTTQWQITIDPSLGLQPGAIASEGSFIVTSGAPHFNAESLGPQPGRLARVLADGTVAFNSMINAVTPPVIGGNGLIFVGTQAAPIDVNGTGAVVAYDLNGNQIWSTAVQGLPNDLLVGDDGAVYAGTGAFNSGRVYTLDQNTGAIRKTITNVPGAWEMMLSGGVLYTAGAAITALPVAAVNYDPMSPWPLRFHENQRTGNRLSPILAPPRESAPLNSSGVDWFEWSTSEGGNGHFYANAGPYLNWHDAENAAEAQGATLVTLTSQAERDFVVSAFMADRNVYWLGGTDETTAGNFRWVTGEPFSYTDWVGGEPNNYGGAENYLAANWHVARDGMNAGQGIGNFGRWNDVTANGSDAATGPVGPYMALFERNSAPVCGDQEPPMTTAMNFPSANGAGWNNTDVAVNLSAQDEAGGSDVASITYSASGAQLIASTTVNAATSSFTISAEGETTITYYASDVAGNHESPKTIVIKIDKTAPTISVTSPTAGSYLLNQAATVDFSCTDNLSGVASCTGSSPNGSALDTASIGAQSVTVSATDLAGNASVPTVVNYTVDDVTAPVADVAALPTISGECSASVTAPTATDNCVGAVTGTTTDPLIYTSQGTFSVTWHYNDGNGNESTQTQSVVVKDTTAPVLDGLPADVTVQCDTVPPPANVTASDNCSGSVTPQLSQKRVDGDCPGNYTLTRTWMATDHAGNSTSSSQVITVQDTTPPTFSTPPTNKSANADANCQAPMPDVTAGVVANDTCSSVTLTQSPVAGTSMPLGHNPVRVTATDACGKATSVDVFFDVTDNTPPSITCPANITMVDNVPGSCGASVTPGTPVTSDNCGIASAVGTRSDGQTLTALYPVGATTITWVVTDASGNTASCLQTITVTNPAPVVSITGPPSGSLYVVNTPVNFTGSFTDNAGDTHGALWTFDGSPQAGIVNEATHTVSASHTFDTAGVYIVTLTVTDDCGQTGATNQVGGFDALVVIYDPDAGFVTGGGWINSPAGSYVPNPSLTGKANFGFVSKYQKGANVPDGQTEFQFKVANLNFRSTIYEWLVVAGARAQYKGSGTINGAGNYGFMLTAIDGQISGGGGIDKFRIKIWDKNNGDAVVYDNQMGAGIDDNPTTALAGGSIVIHK